MSNPKSDKQYEIEYAAETLIKAEAIKKDKVMMKDVKKELKKRVSAVNSALKSNSRKSKKK